MNINQALEKAQCVIRQQHKALLRVSEPLNRRAKDVDLDPI
ncbi:MAG TPA: hypothetical protein VHI52_18580 [Verrucomicrobiae bacterium]|nr:hypothetical protein [Verrucomicrobiae bacterium]